jgi:Tfp pilus assembly major pilin PilA
MPGMPNLPGAMGQPRTSGLAIAGFVCAFLCSLLGFALSLVAYLGIRRSNGQLKGAGFAIAGMAISGVLFVVGILAAVAIPAFMDYTHRGRRVEAPLQLNKLSKMAKVFYIENGRYPVFDQEATPARSCCGQPGNKCQPANDNWRTEPWTALDFEIDEPHLYRYGYKSDGDKLEAVAIGDVDCDGQEATYKLHMTTTNGNATSQIEDPPPGVY